MTTGIVDMVDGRAMVRADGYLPGPNDVSVPMSFVRKHNLRRGDTVSGQSENDRLTSVDTVNGQQHLTRPAFNDLVPLYPNERLRLETEPHILTTRVVDLVMPVGKGQRALVVAPPKAGKTSVLQAIAHGISKNHPECHLMIVLVGERPEEVTDMARSVPGEVIAATFDQPPKEQIALAELAVERAKRLVEMGRDVVVLLDSLTRLGRAYNLGAPAHGRTLSGGVDSAALTLPKRFLGAARNIQDGGSLTMFATALIDTSSVGDGVLFEEYKGTSNAELRLDRKVANRRVYPAVDIAQSGTRKEELLMSPEELAVTRTLRAANPDVETVLEGLRRTQTNYEFLTRLVR
jgi:transcription termination factor Rho